MEWARKEQQGSYAKHPLAFDTEQEIQHLRQDEHYSALIDGLIEAAAATPADRRDKAILLGLDIIEQLMVVTNMPLWQSSALERAEKPAAPYAYWRHIDFSALGQDHWLPSPIRLDDVLEIVADYRKLPFRVAALDRLLLDMVIAAELLVRGESRPSQAGSRRAQFFALRWAKTMVLCGGVAIVVGAIWWIATTTQPITRGAAVAVGLIGLGAILLAARRASRRHPRLDQRLSADAVIGPIYLAYCTLAADRTSANELEEAVEAAKEVGTVWSPGLIDLLDDILARHTTI